ncbi:hypothetical protein [Streptomyces sp. NPDC050704]
MQLLANRGYAVLQVNFCGVSNLVTFLRTVLGFARPHLVNN